MSCDSARNASRSNITSIASADDHVALGQLAREVPERAAHPGRLRLTAGSWRTATNSNAVSMGTHNMPGIVADLSVLDPGATRPPRR